MRRAKVCAMRLATIRTEYGTTAARLDGDVLIPLEAGDVGELRSTPAGPYLVTADEVGTAPDLEVRCEVDDVAMQQSRTSDLLFGAAEIVAYASQAVTLRPGDLFATGT